MKKCFLIGCLILITACQTATPTPETPLSPTATLPPTPIPDTPTPQPSPTLELTPTFVPTPTPLPRFFTTQFDSSLAGWVILQAGNDSLPNISTENNTLRLQMVSPYTWLYVLYGAQDYEDIYVETQFTNSALSPASAGLVCRYSEENGWFEYNVSTDGTYNVLYGRWLTVGIADYLPVIDGSSKEIGQSGTPLNIGLTCSGSTLRLHINGNIIRSMDVTRYELTTGKAGLTASSYENTPVIVSFDWITVMEP